MSTATNKRFAFEIFDAELLDISKNKIANSGFWKEYVSYKIEGIVKFMEHTQNGIDHFKFLTEELDDNEDLEWAKSIKRELERDVEMLRLQEAHSHSYLKFARELRDLEQSSRIIEEDFNKNFKEFKTMEKNYKNIRKTLLESGKKVNKKLEKMETLLLTENDKKSEKLSRVVQELEKKRLRHDALILTEKRLRTNVLKKSDEIEEQFTKKETANLEILLQSWRDCLQSLDDDVTKYATGLFQTKAKRNAANINIGEIVEKSVNSCKRTTHYIELEPSTAIVSKKPECEAYLQTLKGEEGRRVENTSHKQMGKEEIKGEGDDEKEDVMEKKLKRANDDECSNDDEMKTSKTKTKKKSCRKIPKVDCGGVGDIEKENTTSDDSEVKAFSDKDVECSTEKRSVEVRQLPQRPLPAKPTKPSNKWAESGGRSSSQSEELSLTTSKSSDTEENGPFQPKKATVQRSYTKQRPAEISVKKGERVKILNKPDRDGFVCISKKTALKIRTKRGLLPRNLLVIDN